MSKKEIETIAELLDFLKSDGVEPAQYAQYIDRFLDARARTQGVPLEGKFELTPLCNLDCKMCYVHLNKEQMAGSQLMPLESWKEIARQAMEAGMKEVILTGGECLTYPAFDELYLYLQSLGLEIQVYTNGLLLDEARVAFLKEHPVKRMQISLYGASEDGYERVTGRRCFEQVLSNIRRGKEAGLPIHIAITPSVFMKPELHEIVELANSLDLSYGINCALFDPREETGRRGQKLDLTVEEYIPAYEHMARLKGHPPVPVPEEQLPSMDGLKTGTKCGLNCGGGRSSFSIGYDGKMYICGMVRETVAEPLKTGFPEAWKQINAAANAIPVPAACEDCPYRNACPVCVVDQRVNGVCTGPNPALCARAQRLVQAGITCIRETENSEFC